MHRVRAFSSPDLVPSSPSEEYDDSALEGVAAHVKLLLKLIQDHKDACKRQNDGRRMLRVATMMTILDNVRTRIQKCLSFGHKDSAAELRRNNTDLRASHVPRGDKRHCEPVTDEKEMLRKELNASIAARKNLEVMCSSLGKEKEIMAGELARKAHEENEMEELINDLKAQNETLLEKVKQKGFAADRKEKMCDIGGENTQGNAILQDRNKALSEQLLRSLDGFRSMKRKLKEAQEENAVMHATMDEIGTKAGASLDHIRGFKHQIATESKPLVDIQEEISELENMFECLAIKVSKHGHKKGEWVESKGKINACKPSVLA